jgi:hypothetical protein
MPIMTKSQRRYEIQRSDSPALKLRILLLVPTLSNFAFFSYRARMAIGLHFDWIDNRYKRYLKDYWCFRNLQTFLLVFPKMGWYASKELFQLFLRSVFARNPCHTRRRIMQPSIGTLVPRQRKTPKRSSRFDTFGVAVVTIQSDELVIPRITGHIVCQ